MKVTSKNQRTDRFFKLSLILSFFVFLFFILKGITLPFVGPNATNFSVYSFIAHNLNQFGYIETWLAPVISVSQTLPENPEYFFHHPTLLSFIISLFFRLFGEEFWVARLVVILFAFGSLGLTYKLGKEVVNTRFGVIAASVMALIPATTVFGKMIGQEPLVLFFWLSSVYTSVLFLKTEKKLYLLVCLTSVFLGILSDWPMVYFTASLLPLYFFHQKKREGLLVISFALLVLLGLLSYVYVLRNGFWDLSNAVAMRSFFGLTEIPFWPVRWFVLMLVRIAVYFNPIIVILAIISFWSVLRNILKRKVGSYDLIVAGFFFFGVFHMLLYTQASFTHPYLIYYLLPFVVFASSRYILALFERKQFVGLSLLIVFSAIYLLLIDAYKTNQVKVHLWRYEAIKQVRMQLKPYETILVNNWYALDTDIFWYPFLINFRQVSQSEFGVHKMYDHYVFSCPYVCDPYNRELLRLKQTYHATYLKRPEVEVYVFDLKRKNTTPTVLPPVTGTVSPNQSSNISSSTVKNFYRKLRDFLYAPQI